LKLWKAITLQVLDTIIPPSCLVCGERLEEQSQVLCSKCEAKISLQPVSLCKVCGSEIKELPCEVCAEEKFAFDHARSAFRYFTPINDLIHALKYDGYVSPAGYFALPLAELIESDEDLQDYDYLCAVPLHKVRKRERGYNQSDLIAFATAALLDMPYHNPVSRNINTLSQTLLSKSKRQKNLAGAFSVKDISEVKGKKIILVDDVFTTGTTLNEIAKLLRLAGAEKVAAVTVARA
jgi:ComF family protein